VEVGGGVAVRAEVEVGVGVWVDVWEEWRLGQRWEGWVGETDAVGVGAALRSPPPKSSRRALGRLKTVTCERWI
jgi:hypothetical protein